VAPLPVVRDLVGLQEATEGDVPDAAAAGKAWVNHMKRFINWLRSVFRRDDEALLLCHMKLAEAEADVWQWKNAASDVTAQRDRAKRMEQQVLADNKALVAAIAEIRRIVEDVDVDSNK